MRVSSESQFPIDAIKIPGKLAYLGMLKILPAGENFPQSRMEVSTEDTSDCHNLSPCLMLAQW